MYSPFIPFFTADFISVGEEDEVSIKEAVDMIAEALDFKGKIHVSFLHPNHPIHCPHRLV